jgi:hypothetical protein
MAVPADVARSHGDFETWSNGSGTRPNLGEAYGVKVTYSDGSSELLSGSVTTVLDAFANNLAVNRTLYPPDAPLFTWDAPSSPPPSYGYRLSLWGSNASWYYPQKDAMPSGTTSVLYNADGMANPSTLVMGTLYSWAVIVEDPAGNQAIRWAAYTPTP